MTAATIQLRVDVDFHEGLRRGVPYLLDLFEANDVRATFYVVMGPDTLHRHSRRVGERAFRKRVVALNTWKIVRHLGVAYLRSRYLGQQVGPDHPRLIDRIVERGHEFGVHGYDHAEWADRSYEMCADEVRDHMNRAFSVHRELRGCEATTWGAPNWRTCPAMFHVLEERGIAFSSDTRGVHPFLPLLPDGPSSVPQLPITLPCLHELIQHGVPRAHIPERLEACLKPDFNVLCIHDYYEGLLERELFARTLDRLQDRGWSFEPLREAAARYPVSSFDAEPIARVRVPGGARPVCAQRSFLEHNYFHHLEPAAIV